MSALETLRAITTSPQSREIIARLDRDTQSIAEAMTEIHGGHWRIHIDHDDGFVFIVRDQEQA